jgi:rSAM/selenodomain-associated transferase 1
VVVVAGAPVAAILTRAPSAGGKSRLFGALGRPPDPALLEALLLDTLDGAHVPGVTRLVAVEPADACDAVRALVPADVSVIPQPRGTLGERMAAVMQSAFDGGAVAVAVLGSDLPDLQPALVARAFETLAADPDSLVIGPALDGGYYLIAATKVPDLFDAIEWGTERVLAQTLAAAERSAMPVRLLSSLSDIDVPDDLRRSRGRRTSAWSRVNLR